MVYNPQTASVTELRQNATQLLKQANASHEPLFILQNSKKAGVLLDIKSFEELMELYMDRRDYEIAVEAMNDKSEKTYTWEEVKKMRNAKHRK